jgi:hypothetical protein
MASRTSSKQVTFRRPFWLSGLDSRQPAGTYTVDTEEERVEELSFLAWRRVATNMRVARGGTTEYIPIDPSELNDALARDTERLNRPHLAPTDGGDAALGGLLNRRQIDVERR